MYVVLVYSNYYILRHDTETSLITYTHEVGTESQN